MRAIILAAGQGTRLAPLTNEKPKALVRVAGKPILQHQIDAYLSAGIAERDIYVVAGYQSQKIDFFLNEKYKKVRIVQNTDYAHTNNMYSLWLSLSELSKGEKTDCLVSNGDCVYENSTVKAFAGNKRSNLVACKVGYFDNEAMKITVSEEGRVTDISKELDRSSFGISMDLFKISVPAQHKLVGIMENYFACYGKKDWNEKAFPELFRECRFEPFEVKNSAWCEIDNLADLGEADRLFSPMRIKDKTCFILDWDGTLFLGANPITPAIDFLKFNAERYMFYFLSNNTSLLPEDLAEKLKQHGLSFKNSQFITPLKSLEKYFSENKIQKAFVLANERVRNYLKVRLPKGISLLCDDVKECESLVICYDTELTYEKLKTASILLNSTPPVHYVATHLDLVCPSPEGPLPDAGSIVAMLKNTSGREPDFAFGKPNPGMLADVINERPCKEIAVVGDRLYTDHVLAREIGCDFVCVLSGETKRIDLEKASHFPGLIVDDVGCLGELT